MKWTEDYVWYKVESVVPNARLCEYALPEGLKAAAVNLFLMGEGVQTGSYRAYVIKTCIKELQSQGWLTFGDVDEDWG